MFISLQKSKYLLKTARKCAWNHLKDLSNRPQQQEEDNETYNEAGTLLIPLPRKHKSGTEADTISDRIARLRDEKYLRDLQTHRYTDIHVEYSQAILEVELEVEEEKVLPAATLEAGVDQHTMPNDKENPE